MLFGVEIDVEEFFEEWHFVEVSYDHGKSWNPVAIFFYEVEAVAYLERHNGDGSGRLRKSLASMVETSVKPGLPAPIRVLTGNSISTSNQ